MHSQDRQQLPSISYWKAQRTLLRRRRTGANDYPDQVACIFLRNTSATDPSDKFPYDTSKFEGLRNESYMFFHVPDDLRGLDIANGECLNKTVMQNVTFGIQDEVLGIHGAGVRVGGSAVVSFVVAVVVGMFVAL